MASTVTSRSPGRGDYQRQSLTVITNAQIATSDEMAGRVKRYAITMAFRTACFLAMIFVPGVLRWVLFACAVVLPYVAVLLANQAHTKTRTDGVPQATPQDQHPQLTTGPAEGEVIAGDVIDDDRFGRAPQSAPDDRVA